MVCRRGRGAPLRSGCSIATTTTWRSRRLRRCAQANVSWLRDFSGRWARFILRPQCSKMGHNPCVAVERMHQGLGLASKQGPGQATVTVRAQDDEVDAGL